MKFNLKKLIALILSFVIAMTTLVAPASAFEVTKIALINSNPKIEQNADHIENIFQEGISKACAIGGTLGNFVGGAIGAYGSVTAVTSLGVAGASGAGIASGLAALGSIVGGGMLAGVTVAAAVPVVFSVAGGGLACLVSDIATSN